jgi:hypothetical protein
MSLQQRSQRPLDIKGKANKCFKRFAMISVELAIDQRLRSCLVDMRNCPEHTSYEGFIGEVSDVTDSIDASDMGLDKVFIKEGSAGAFECEDPMRMGRSDSDDERVLRSDECA